jgi:hypothetical protein
MNNSFIIGAYLTSMSTVEALSLNNLCLNYLGVYRLFTNEYKIAENWIEKTGIYYETDTYISQL